MKSIRDRFQEKYEITEDGCWVWIACVSSTGYGSFHMNKKTQNAHRVSYEMHIGEILKGYQLDHLCKRRACVNPEHLEPVLAIENVQRGDATKEVCEHGFGATRCKLGCGKTYQRLWQQNKHGYKPRKGLK